MSTVPVPLGDSPNPVIRALKAQMAQPKAALQPEPGPIQAPGMGQTVPPIGLESAKPRVIGPKPGQVIGPVAAAGSPQALSDEHARLAATGSGASQIKNKPLRILAETGNVIGGIVAPGLMRALPGTEEHHELLLARNQNEIANQLGNQQKAATVASTQAEVPYREAQVPLAQAQTHEAEARANALENPAPPVPKYELKETTDPQGNAIYAAVNQNDPNDVHPIPTLKVPPKAPSTAAPPHITAMKGGQPHIMERDPQTGEYSIDRGLAPPNYAMLGGSFRLAPAQLDTMNDNAPVTLTVDELKQAQKETPGRFIPAGTGEKALGRTALIEDIRGNINSVRDVLKSQKLPSFDAAQRAKLAVVLGGGEKGAIDAMLTGEFMDSLNPAQQDYVIGLSQLVENAMAMRSVLGAGQGSEQLRDAIRRTIPTAANPNPQYSLKQLDALEAVLNRLEKGIPKVKLGQGGEEQTAPAFKVRLKDAMALPQNKGKSEANVRRDVQAHGGEVVE